MSTPLSEGEHELKVKTTDKAGNTADADPVTITVDTKIVDARVEFIEDKNNDGKFSWNENLTNEHPGRLSWKAIIPQDGSVKAGDIFHYKWDETGWHERPVSQAEIDRGYMGEMKNNQVQENGKIGVYGIGSNGDSYVAEAYFSDAAGNIGKKGQDEIVFDFTGAPRTKLDASAIYGNGDETFLLFDHGRKSDQNITEAAKGKDVKTFTHGAEVKLDNGDDIVTVNNKHGWGWINEDSKLDLGRGNNTLNVGTNIDKSTVAAGNGDDTVNVGNWIREHSDINLGDGNNTLTVGNIIVNSTVATGDGNDTRKVKNAIIGSTVKLGAGDDTVEVGNKDITDNTLTGKSNIDGGDGYDKLTITNPGTTINLSNIASQAHNFEELNISNKSQNTTLSVKLSDVISLTDGDNTLKITADAGDKVEFKDTGWQKGASTDGYTAYTNDTSGTTVTVEIKDEVTQPM